MKITKRLIDVLYLILMSVAGFFAGMTVIGGIHSFYYSTFKSPKYVYFCTTKIPGGMILNLDGGNISEQKQDRCAEESTIFRIERVKN